MIHEPKFRGIWTPADVFILFTDGKITALEYVLVGLIDSLVDVRGEGCWASNSYLARKLRVTEDHVQRMIGHLKSLGLIKQVGWKKLGPKNYRILETKWSRIEVVITDVQVVPNAICTPLQVDPNTTCVPVQVDPNTTHINKSIHSSYSSSSVGIREIEGGESDRSAPPPAPTISSPLKPANNISLQKRDIPAVCYEFTKQLRKILKTSNKGLPVVKSTHHSCAEHFRVLLGRIDNNTARVKQLLDWYEIKINEIDKPTIVDAKHFCSPTVFKWLEDLFMKDGGEPINTYEYFETIVKDGKKTHRKLHKYEEAPKDLRVLGKNGISKWLNVKKWLDEGKTLPEWHWEGNDMVRTAAVNEPGKVKL